RRDKDVRDSQGQLRLVGLMATARVNSINLFYEDEGAGVPLVFVHEFAGDSRSWHLQTRFFARRYRTIAFNARGYPPSDVPEDPTGWREFHAQLVKGSARGHALTLRGVQKTRPAIFDLGPRLEKLEVPTLIMTGDEDDPCLEPAIFMKRTIPTAGLVVIPKSG